MFLIIDGIDNTGKTTIAKVLAEELDLYYFKNPSEQLRFKNEDFNNSAIVETQYLLSLLKQVQFKKGIIFDRHLPSLFAYSDAFDRPLDLELFKSLEMQFVKHNFKVIYCHKDKFKEWHDEFVDVNHINVLQSAFNYYFQETLFEHFYINTTDENLEEQLEEIKMWLQII